MIIFKWISSFVFVLNLQNDLLAFKETCHLNSCAVFVKTSKDYQQYYVFLNKKISQIFKLFNICIYLLRFRSIAIQLNILRF